MNKPGTEPEAPRETIPASLEGERLDRFVAMITGCSRAEAAQTVSSGLVRVNGDAVTARARRLSEGDVVAVDGVQRAPAPEARPDPTVLVDVVYEDPDVLVIEKPAGLVVHPGAGHLQGTLVDGLLAGYPDLGTVDWPDPVRPGVVHRLDRDTSGLLMVARTAAAFESLTGQLASHSVERTYRALVWGSFDTAAGQIDAPVGRSTRDPTRMTVKVGGKPARTSYTVDRVYADPVVSLVSCRLFTGRTHQIRVHMSSIGHPVLGDARYGGARAALRSPRMFLHAATLGFEHPLTGEAMSFTSQLPGDLVEVLSRVS